MFRVSSYSLVAIPLLLALTTAACGGPKKPITPTADTAEAGVDMPGDSGAVATADGGASSDTPGVPEPTPAPAALALPSATAKIAMKGKKPATIEIKPDGTVSNAGKAVAKLSGMALQNADGGKALLTVDVTGSVTTEGGGAYGSFTGDELTLAKGDKLAIADDGVVNMTTGAKAAPLGKFENLGAAKRAGLLAVAFIVAPPAAEKPAAKPAGDKPAGDKPAGAKPAGKPKPKAKP